MHGYRTLLLEKRDAHSAWLQLQRQLLEEDIAVDTVQGFMPFLHTIIHMSFCTLQNFLNIDIKSCGNISLFPVLNPVCHVSKFICRAALSWSCATAGTSSLQLWAVFQPSPAKKQLCHLMVLRGGGLPASEATLPRGRGVFCQQNQIGNYSSCENR